MNSSLIPALKYCMPAERIVYKRLITVISDVTLESKKLKRVNKVQT